MADKTIGELPSIANVTDASLIPVEQSGVAGKMTGAQFKAWGAAAAQPSADAAAQSAQAAAQSAFDAGASEDSAAESASQAASSAATAAAAKQAILDMTVEAETLDPGSAATVAKTEVGGVAHLTFGLPRGAVGQQGATGPRGLQGVQGPKGDTGTAVAVETAGMYYFSVDNDSTSPTYGHLMLTYTGDTAPNFSINEQGHLIWTIEEESA